MPQTRKSSASTIPGLERGMRVMEYLARSPDGAGLSDMADNLGYPLNSVFRITNTLMQLGYIGREPVSKRFFLTRKAFSLAYNREADRNLMQNSLDPMRKLRDQLRETVVVSILDDREGLILEQVSGLHPFRFVCDAGTRQVLHTSASCKAILAFLPAGEVTEILRGYAYVALTSRSITSAEAFDTELANVRSLGYAVDRGEALEGVHCVAAPVFDRQGRAMAAITVTGPAQRLTEDDFPRFGAVVRQCAGEISERMGFGLLTLHGLSA